MTLRQHLDALIAAGELTADPAQAEGAAALDRLLATLQPVDTDGNVVTRLFRKKKATSEVAGVYLYGPVGRGKTMLMDAFLQIVPGQIRVMRTHFHRFMLGVHDFSHERQKAGDSKRMDQVLSAYADKLAADYDLIAFDEFHVVDVADAMLLGRLTKALLERGIRLVMTSNWPPEDLYKGGLQRDRFVAVIKLIRAHFLVAEVAGAQDYRRARVSASDLYISPLGDAANATVARLFAQLTGGEEAVPVDVPVKGRLVHIPKSGKGVAQASFVDLCAHALGAQDYLALAARFHTLILTDVPALTADKRNEAKRLMILVDVFYEQHRLLVITADALPDALYNGEDHGFEFQRTASRLMEMQSQEYLSQLA